MQEKDDYISTAIAYQIAFDLYDNGTQEFLAKVIKSLPAKVAEIPMEKEIREYPSYLGRVRDIILTNIISNRNRSTAGRIERSFWCPGSNRREIYRQATRSI